MSAYKLSSVVPVNKELDNVINENINENSAIIDKDIKCKNTIPFCKRQSTTRNLFSKQMDNLYDIIYTHYKDTPAFDLSNRNKEAAPLYFSGANNIPNRAKRWLYEDYIIVEQNNWTRFNYLFTFILVALTIVIIIVIYKNNLVVVPKNIIKEETMTEDDKKTIRDYKSLDLTYQIISGCSALYIIGLSSWRIFKRTTI